MSTLQDPGQVSGQEKEASCIESVERETNGKAGLAGNEVENEVVAPSDDKCGAPSQRMTIAKRASFDSQVQPSNYIFSLNQSHFVAGPSSVTCDNGTTIEGLPTPSAHASHVSSGMAVASDKLRAIEIRFGTRPPSNQGSPKQSKQSSTVLTAKARSKSLSPHLRQASSDPNASSKAGASHAENVENTLLSSRGQPQASVLRLVVDSKKMAAIKLREQGHLLTGAVPSKAKPGARAVSIKASSPAYSKAAEYSFQTIKSFHAMVTEASQSPDYRELLRWSDDGSFVHCASKTWETKSGGLEHLIGRHFSEKKTFIAIRRRFREFCGGQCSKTNGNMFHPRFHRDDSSEEALRSVTKENATASGVAMGPNLEAQSSVPLPTVAPGATRRAAVRAASKATGPKESEAAGPKPMASMKRKTSGSGPPGKKRRNSPSSFSVRTGKGRVLSIGKQPRLLPSATTASTWVVQDFCPMRPTPKSSDGYVALKGKNLKTSPIVGGGHGSRPSLPLYEGSRVQKKGLLGTLVGKYSRWPENSTSTYKTPGMQSWRRSIDEMMFEPIQTGLSSALTPVTLPGSPSVLIAVFTPPPPPKRVLFDLPPAEPSQLVVESASQSSTPTTMVSDVPLDYYELLEDLSVTEVVAL